jgi:hypothetical protein
MKLLLLALFTSTATDGFVIQYSKPSFLFGQQSQSQRHFSAAPIRSTVTSKFVSYTLVAMQREFAQFGFFVPVFDVKKMYSSTSSRFDSSIQLFIFCR